MFGLQIVDVALGLVFIYLTLALACTSINEIIATLMRMRSNTLREGLHHLLNDPKFFHPDGDARGLETRFYEHPMIKSLYEGHATPESGASKDSVARARPSYIPGPTFAAVILDVIAPAMDNATRTMSDIRQRVTALPQDCDLRRTMLVLMDTAGDDVARLHRNIEAWFEQAMERVSGWYRRRVHTLTLICGVLVTLIMNADSLRIAHVLANDPKELSTVLQQVEQVYNRHQLAVATSPDSSRVIQTLPLGDSLRLHSQELSTSMTDLRNAGVPLGWKLNELPVAWHGSVNEHWGIWLLRKLSGLALTAVAVSMGAPFWFDLLGRFMTVRGVGQRPASRRKNTAGNQ